MIFKIKNLFILFCVQALLSAVVFWQGLPDSGEIQSKRITFLQSSIHFAIQRSHQHEYKKLTKLFYVPVLYYSTPSLLNFSWSELSSHFHEHFLAFFHLLSSSNRPRAPPVASLLA
jgi:hypothetical protein